MPSPPLQCVDEPGYTDAHGISCRDWSTHEDCNIASDFGYTEEQVRQLFRRCPRSCNICIPEVPTTSDKASESTNTPSSSSDVVLVSAIVVIGVALLLFVGSAMYRKRPQSSLSSTAVRKLEAGGPYEYVLSGDSPDPEPLRERVAPADDDVTIYASIMGVDSVRGALNAPRPSARPPRRSGLRATGASYLAPDPNEEGPRQATLAARGVANSPDSASEYAGVAGDEVSAFRSDDEACYPLAVPSQLRTDPQESLYDNLWVGLGRTNRPKHPGSAARVDIDARAHALHPLSPPDLSFRGDTADFRSMCDDLMDMMTTGTP